MHNIKCTHCKKGFRVNKSDGVNLGDEDYRFQCPYCGWWILKSFAFKNGKRVIPISIRKPKVKKK